MVVFRGECSDGGSGSGSTDCAFGSDGMVLMKVRRK